MKTSELNKVREYCDDVLVSYLKDGKGNRPVGGTQSLSVGDVIEGKRFSKDDGIFNSESTGMTDEQFSDLSDAKKLEVGGRAQEWPVLVCAQGRVSLRNFLASTANVKWDGDKAPDLKKVWKPNTRIPSDFIASDEGESLGTGRLKLKVVAKGTATGRFKSTVYAFEAIK